MRQSQTPTLSLFTEALAHRGHLCFCLLICVIRVHCFLTDVPPRDLSLRPKVFFFLGIHQTPKDTP